MCQALTKIARRTVFSTVRFGDVLGSNGGVVPLTTKQIEQGGPVTVTHPEMTRYFARSPTVCWFSKPLLWPRRRIFVLEMGGRSNSSEMARHLIPFRLYSGRNPITVIGLRPAS
jgi:FlaA1/EpsC-like NDP-sugar epimerase